MNYKPEIFLSKTKWSSQNATASSLTRLLEVSNRATQAYGIAIPTIRKSALKNLITILLQQHVAHAKHLQHHLRAFKFTNEPGSLMRIGDRRTDSVWNQIDVALVSGKEVLVLNGCRCVERTVTAEYRVAVKASYLDAKERQFLTHQLAELICGQESIDLYCSSPFRRFVRRATFGLTS